MPGAQGCADRTPPAHAAAGSDRRLHRLAPAALAAATLAVAALLPVLGPAGPGPGPVAAATPTAHPPFTVRMTPGEVAAPGAAPASAGLLLVVGGLAAAGAAGLLLVRRRTHRGARR